MSSINRRFSIALCVAAVAISVWPTTGHAHDASAWGGLFRSQDGGATWFQASTGKVIGGVLAVAVDPADSTHLLLGTDSGLLGTHNGGRDWDLRASDTLVGAVLAVAFDAGGHRMLAASGSGLAQSEDGVVWRSTVIPVGASPARDLVAGTTPDSFFLIGWHGLFRTDDGGATWSELRPGPAAQTVTGLRVDAALPERLVAVVGGEVWLSQDGGRSWMPRQAGLPIGEVQMLALDARPAGGQTLWAAGRSQVFRTDDGGLTWRPIGRALPEANTEIRGIAVGGDDDARSIVLSTDRGLFASPDNGASWRLLGDNLPGHIEAGRLVRDARQQATLYVGFSVTPYAELWRNAALGGSSLARLGSSELAGASAFLVLIGLGAVLALRWLAHRSPGSTRLMGDTGR
jgi:photosystem II stability/assembly factor-like uncharacterized protein